MMQLLPKPTAVLALILLIFLIRMEYHLDTGIDLRSMVPRDVLKGYQIAISALDICTYI